MTIVEKVRDLDGGLVLLALIRDDGERVLLVVGKKRPKSFGDGMI